MNAQMVCEVCGIFVEISKYEMHKKFGHKKTKEDHKCNICDKTFKNISKLQHHMDHHINARSFVCTECPKAFNTATGLSLHQQTHNKDPLYCEECGMFFENRRKFNTHMKIHPTKVKLPPQNAIPKECPLCEKVVKNLLKHNLSVHMNQRNYNCDFCDKKFNKKFGLDRHVMTVHMKLKNFKCELCEKSYKEKVDLKKHEQKIHFCEKCEQHFENLKQHNEEIHDEDVQLEKHAQLHFCTICGGNFENLQQHNEDEHVKLLHYCERCLKEFERMQDLERHMKRKHSIMFSFFCDHCEKGFAKKFQIERHLEDHKRQFMRETKVKKQEEFMWIQ